MSGPATAGTDAAAFTVKMASYKQLIDADIAAYSQQLQQATLKQYGEHARLEVDAFLAILERGGKRLRGALTMLAYEMCGGTDLAMIVQAARAIEMIQAYILIVDDIQDRSAMRRGGPAAHVMLAEHHRKNALSGDADHFGLAVALNAALGGMHRANSIFSKLNVREDLRLDAIDALNEAMTITAHGQTSDLVYEMVDEVDEKAVERVFELKTANYTVLNPLRVGMILAGAKPNAVIGNFAIAAGKAFQITNDILGTFGGKEKASMDDIREGKRTLMVIYALENTKPADKAFLFKMLGNENLTSLEFERCKELLVSSGALDYTKAQAKKYAEQAITTLEQVPDGWSAEGTQFLRGFAQYILGRQY